MADVAEILILLVIVGLLILRRPRKDKLPRTIRNLITVVDTCGLIDGRILELSTSGFAPGILYIPQFVLLELQHLADGSDSQKRERARFGLEVVSRLQECDKVKVIIDDSDFPGITEVDEKLVALAQKHGANLYTTDYNLNKVADITGVVVLNVNELAHSLRPIALPGEQKHIKIVQKGSNRNQGVGYLDDGTMIVVDEAASSIGKTVDVEVTRTHQTVAGKMIFAKKIKQQARAK